MTHTKPDLVFFCCRPSSMLSTLRLSALKVWGPLSVDINKFYIKMYAFFSVPISIFNVELLIMFYV